MIRYYGFYSNKIGNLLEKVYELYGRKLKKHIKNISERKKEIKNKLQHFKFCTHMIESYSSNPLLCTCSEIMIYDYSYNPIERNTSNDRQYRVN